MTPTIRVRSLVLLLLALVGAAACDRPDPPAPEPTAARDGGDEPSFPLRLGPGAFAQPSAPFGRAVATIDGETRAVVAQPETRSIYSGLGLSPENDVIRVTLGADALPQLPPGGVSLRVQSYPAAMPDELLEGMVAKTPFKRIATGWQLVTDDDGGVLAWTAPPASEKSRYNLHLEAVLPGPDRFSSTRFDLRAGTIVEIAYGLTTNTHAAGFVPVRFRAWLRCQSEAGRRHAGEGDHGQLLADETIGGAPNPGWRDQSFTQRSAASGCELELEARDLEGQTPPGAVFSVPRFVSPQPDDEPNLIVISLDTLRADHLSGYGYPRATSPRIDAEMIDRGTMFADVTSTYTRTDVSHMSIFSGLYGEARPNPRRMHANTPVPLLAERLRDAGFHTAAFTEDGLISGSFGFWWGFESFVEFNFDEVTSGASTFDRARRYLRERGNRRFFLFVHTYKTHSPYASAETYQNLFSDPSEWERPEMQIGVKPKGRATADAYDRTIREADDAVGDLLDELSALGLADRTLVVLLSDHGEALTEHGAIGHSFQRFQEVLHVPLVIRGPGIPAGHVVREPVSLVDVAPTLLDWLELPPLEPTQGISLAPAFRGNALPEDRPLFFSWLADGALGVRRAGWKYMTGSRKALYDLSTDPEEKKPLEGTRFPEGAGLLERHRLDSSRLRDEFEAATVVTDSTASSAETISEETERALRALGYVE